MTIHKPSTTPPLVLASSSATRLTLIRNAGLAVTPDPARIDETAITRSLLAEGARPRDVADTLAELKAARVAPRNPGAVVIGCDQVAARGAEIFGKPSSLQDARSRLTTLRSQTHSLFSAVVVYHDGNPVWRHVAEARLTMRSFSDAWLETYLSRNWETIRHSAGGYLVEAEGIRLFSRIEGDWPTILGLPILPLFGYLGDRGFIPA
jgi:septum formation protein